MEAKVIRFLDLARHEHYMRNEKFAALAYTRAINSIKDLSKPLTTVDDIKGIGPSIRAKIATVMDTKVTYFGLHEPTPDPDGMYDGMIHPIEQARIFQGMSWWGLGSGLMGISHGKVAMGSAVCIAAVVAHMFWWKPQYNWRRTLDMVLIHSLLVWHAYTGLYSEAKVLYYSITVLGMGLYLLGWEALKRGDSWLATFLHMGVTACANLSLLVLYSYPLTS